MSKEAMTLALEAMQYADACLKKQLTTKTKHEYAQDLLLEAGKALEEALKQEQGEPVAQCTNSDTWNCKYCRKTETCKALKDQRNFGQPKQEQGEPVAYLCENAVGHKYFRWKKPSSTYKPIALYTAPQPAQKPLTDEFGILEMTDIGKNSLQLIFESRKYADKFKAAHGIKENT